MKATLPVALKKWKLLETAYQLINHPPISVPNKPVDPWRDSNQVWDDDDVAAWDFQQKNVTRFFSLAKQLHQEDW